MKKFFLSKPPKSWINRLFCKHSWVQMGNLELYSNNTSKRPIQSYGRWFCENCGQLKKIRYF